MSEETDTFDALTMDGGPFDSLRVTRTEDGGIKLSISRDAIVFSQEASGTMCAEDARELAKWLTPDVHEQLDALALELSHLRPEWQAVCAERDQLRLQVERYGANQWRRGNAGQEPQEFSEWQREI